MQDLKFTTAGDYMTDVELSQDILPYFINESGQKIDRLTGALYYEFSDNGQCLPP
jgi:hypothetical protein